MWRGFWRTPSPGMRGEGRGEGAYPLGSESRRGPLTRIAALRLQSDLSPRDGERYAAGSGVKRARGGAHIIIINFFQPILNASLLILASPLF
jgi:hypothetical protein